MGLRPARPRPLAFTEAFGTLDAQRNQMAAASTVSGGS